MDRIYPTEKRNAIIAVDGREDRRSIQTRIIPLRQTWTRKKECDPYSHVSYALVPNR